MSGLAKSSTRRHRSTFFLAPWAASRFDHVLHVFCYVEMMERPRGVTVETGAETSFPLLSPPNLSPPDRRRVLSPNPSAHAGAQARAGNLWAKGVCRIRQGTSAASGGSLPDGATIPFNFGSQDAPEDGGAMIRKGGSPSLCIAGRRRPHPTINFSRPCRPALLLCANRLRFAAPDR